MRERYVPAIIMLTAGAITCILDIYNKVEVLTGLKRLLLVLVIFYILGLTAVAVVRKVKAPMQKPGNNSGSEYDSQTDDKNTDNETDNVAENENSKKAENGKK